MHDRYHRPRAGGVRGSITADFSAGEGGETVTVPVPTGRQNERLGISGACRRVQLFGNDVGYDNPVRGPCERGVNGLTESCIDRCWSVVDAASLKDT